MKRRKGVVVLVFLMMLFQSSFSQSNYTEDNKIENIKYFSKIWGYLKYYHPIVASGKFDWDEEFLRALPKISTLETKEEKAAFYINWIDGLGEVKVCKKCNENTKKEYSSKNFDLNWLSSNFFTPALQEKLRNIEKNRFYGKPEFVSVGKTGNVVLVNEKTYSNLGLPSESYRLLDLARYWNTIEYFFPYKYLIGQDWDDVLAEMIPKFINVNSEQDYNLVRLELITALNDTHAFFTVHEINNFGAKWIPSMFYITRDSIPIISKHYNDSLAKLNDLKIGDKILEVDGINVKTIIRTRSKYIPASNLASKFRKFQHAILNGNLDSINITIDRAGETINKTIGRYSANMLNGSKSELSKPFKIINENIGYVQLNTLKISKKEVTKLVEKYKKTCPKAIIFDVRSYPPYSTDIVNILGGSEKQAFVRRLLPDISYPGKFYWEDTLKSGGKNKEAYKGKIIILVNEFTQSRGEYITMLLQALENSITIGRQTAGADGTVTRYQFFDNKKTMFTGVGIYYPNKEATQRKGVKIDIEVTPDVKSIIEGKDEILEKALELLH